MFPVPDIVSKYFFYPLWDVYDRSRKLSEMRRLERLQWEPWQTKRARQWERVKETAAYAQARSPFYRRRPPVAVETPEDLARLPILEKKDLRDHLDEMIVDGQSKESLVQAKTGGSTGVSLVIYYDVRCEEKRNAAALMTNRWSGWDLGRPVGALWGNPPVARTFKEKTRAQCLDRLLYLDTVHLTDESMTVFAEALRRRNIQYLFGHAHSLFIFAQFARARYGKGLPMKGIVSTSMMLLPSERRVIEDVFQTPVTNRYGCEELGLLASECERREGMHLNMDQHYIEFIRDDGRPAAPGEEGHLVVTDLINRGMPLLRYRVGDVGVPTDRPCPCGRGWPLMEKLTGRTADFLIAENGGLVAGVSLVERTLTAIPGLQQLQIVQDRRDRVLLNVVPDDRYDPSSEKALLKEMAAALGRLTFDVHKRDRLDQDRNGKYRFAVCRVENRYQGPA